MIERLFLYGVDAESTGASIAGKDYGSVTVGPHITGAALAFAQLAVPRAQVALNAAIFQAMPV